MRSVSLLLAAEDNRLVREFSDKVYAHLPEDLQRHYNDYFGMKFDTLELKLDLTGEVAQEVIRDMLYCQEYARKPDFDIDKTIEVIDKILPDIIRAIEYSQTHPTNDETFKKGQWSEETVSLVEENKLPKDYYSLEVLRAYCKYLKACPQTHPDIEPPEYVLKVFQKAINEGSVALSEKPINGKKRFLLLVKIEHFYIDKEKFPYVSKDFLREWLYDNKGKQRSKGFYKSYFSF